MTREPMSVLMQGPVTPHTKDAVASVRKWFPDAELVLSTWNEQDVEGLDIDYSVWTVDPGPGAPEAMALQRGNLVRMVVGVKNGLLGVHNQLVLKVRSDVVFTGDGCLAHLDEWERRRTGDEVFGRRIMVPSTGTADPDVHLCFHVSDWVMLGDKTDLQFLFDVPLTDDCWHPPISPEQYLWFRGAYDRKFPGAAELPYSHHKTLSLCEATKDFFANNLVVLDTKSQFQLYSSEYAELPDEHWVNLRHAKWARLYEERT